MFAPKSPFSYISVACVYGEYVPEQFRRIPDINSYLDVNYDCLFSTHVHAG